MRRVLLITALLLITATLSCCNNPTKNIPGIDTFSGVELDLDNAFGTQILSATLKLGETEFTISQDDPRLVRLLNLLFYSEEDRTTTMRQGLVLDEEIHKRLLTNSPILDISLQAGQNSSSFLGKSSQIVVCKDCYIIIYTNHKAYEGLVAEEFFPFRGLIPVSKQEDYPYADWGAEGWIDLLEYSGFVDADDIPLK